MCVRQLEEESEGGTNHYTGAAEMIDGLEVVRVTKPLDCCLELQDIFRRSCSDMTSPRKVKLVPPTDIFSLGCCVRACVHVSADSYTKLRLEATPTPDTRTHTHTHIPLSLTLSPSLLQTHTFHVSSLI